MTRYLRPEDEFAGVFAAVAEASDDAIITKDLNDTIRSWNSAAERLYGYTPAETIGRSVSMIVPADRRSELAAIMERIRSGQRVERHETVRLAKDGRLVDVSIMVVPIRNAAGTVIGAATLAHNLATRKRTESALQTSEARWRSVIESAVDGIVVIDARGLIESFNPAAERLFGYAEHEVVGRNVSMLMPSPYHEEHDGYLAHYLATGHKKIIGIGREVTARRRDGSTFPIHLAVGEMTGSAERKFTGILHDLSDRVRIEQRLREQSTLARLGEMAAVVAHEVKNPLAGVRGAIQVIGTRLPQESKEAAIIKEITARIDALNSLMQDLLLFARPPQPKLQPVNVAALIVTTADLLKSDPRHAGVGVVVDGTVPSVDADADLLKIVFENLLVNGSQAMQGRGAIRVSLAAIGDDCRIVFADTGPGMPADVREKIFVPFFTTKARGTGLGLPTAKRLLEAHGGQIEVACPPEGGTTITIHIPAASPVAV